MSFFQNKCLPLIKRPWLASLSLVSYFACRQWLLISWIWQSAISVERATCISNCFHISLRISRGNHTKTGCHRAELG